MEDGSFKDDQENHPWWMENSKSGNVLVKLLAPHPDNARVDSASFGLEELASSMREQGVRNTLIVSPIRYCTWLKLEPEFAHCKLVIISGHRRLAAAKLADLESVPILVKVYDSEAEMYDAILEGNNEQQPYSDIELARIIIRLMRAKKSLRDIQKQVRAPSQQWCRDQAILLRLPEQAQKQMSFSVSSETRLERSVGIRLARITCDSQGELRGWAAALELAPPDLDGTDPRLMSQWVMTILFQKWTALKRENGYREEDGVRLINEYSKKKNSPGPPPRRQKVQTPSDLSALLAVLEQVDILTKRLDDRKRAGIVTTSMSPEERIELIAKVQAAALALDELGNELDEYHQRIVDNLGK